MPILPLISLIILSIFLISKGSDWLTDSLVPIAKKLKTFYEREEGKDIYDLYYSLKVVDNVGKAIPILKDVLAAAEIDYKEFVEEFPKKLADSTKIRSLHASTNPYIPRNLRINWIAAAKAVSKSIVWHL